MCILRKINNLKVSLQNRSIEIRNLKLWISKKCSNSNFIKDYLKNKKIKNVALVGNGIYTDILIEELVRADIRIAYVIGSTWSTNTYGIQVLSKPEKQVDAIISTSISKETYEGYKVISIFDILYNK